MSGLSLSSRYECAVGSGQGFVSISSAWHARKKARTDADVPTAAHGRGADLSREAAPTRESSGRDRRDVAA